MNRIYQTTSLNNSLLSQVPLSRRARHTPNGSNCRFSPYRSPNDIHNQTFRVITTQVLPPYTLVRRRPIAESLASSTRLRLSSRCPVEDTPDPRGMGITRWYNLPISSYWMIGET